MPDQILRIAVPVLLFLLAAYGVGLRPSGRLPLLRLAAPAPVFAWLVQAAARSRLRKAETIRDRLVYREGKVPEPKDLTRVQIELIAGLGIVLVFLSTAT